VPTTTTTVTVPMTVSDPATACCAGCPDPKPKTLYLNTANHGMKTLSYDSLAKNWTDTYQVTFDCADSAPDPLNTPTSLFPGPCLVPVNTTSPDSLTVKVVVSCPDGTGRWRVQFSSTAEETYHQWLGARFATGQCGGYVAESVSAPAVHADTAGCSTTQSFAAPGAANWTGASGHVYSGGPDPGASTLSA
jgi:hypothetical protein